MLYINIPSFAVGFVFGKDRDSVAHLDELTGSAQGQMLGKSK